MDSLTQAERGVFLKLLDLFSDLLMTSGSNDFQLDDTPENRAVVMAAVKHELRDDPEEAALADEDDLWVVAGTITTSDSMLLAYLESKIKGESDA